MSMQQCDVIGYTFVIADIGVILLNGGLGLYNFLEQAYALVVVNMVGVVIGVAALRMAVATMHQRRNLDRLQTCIDTLELRLNQD